MYKLVCTGAKSEELSHVAARKYARIIQKLGFDVCFKDFKIQNVVASCNAGSPICLRRMSTCYGSYEPELFPGLTYRLGNGVIINVFASGKFVITGTSTTADVYITYDRVIPILKRFIEINQAT